MLALYHCPLGEETRYLGEACRSDKAFVLVAPATPNPYPLAIPPDKVHHHTSALLFD